ncbi:hypothetical protein CCMA1212_006571 [Trichoderma ghanense]|uniref:Uncharacterized protein n=1 Tax=Trichoderma ghanense TaxID=65468 RepID=A0ABY2H2C7_9HYPO
MLHVPGLSSLNQNQSQAKAKPPPPPSHLQPAPAQRFALLAARRANEAFASVRRATTACEHLPGPGRRRPAEQQQQQQRLFPGSAASDSLARRLLVTASDGTLFLTICICHPAASYLIGRSPWSLFSVSLSSHSSVSITPLLLSSSLRTERPFSGAQTLPLDPPQLTWPQFQLQFPIDHH